MSGNWFEEDPTLTKAQRESELEINFTSATTYTLTEVDTNTVLATRDYQSGDELVINGWVAVLNNAPAVGDKFTVSKNTSPKGDNRNILALAELQTDRAVFEGRGNFSEVYADVINDLGSVVVQSSIARDAQQVLTDEAKQARDSVSAVALDEEAANLLRFQQAYQASAQVIQAANKLFDWIVNIK
jgi:flagellar hook-associated protein 1 FlgK